MFLYNASLLCWLCFNCICMPEPPQLPLQIVEAPSQKFVLSSIYCIVLSWKGNSELGQLVFTSFTTPYNIRRIYKPKSQQWILWIFFLPLFFLADPILILLLPDDLSVAKSSSSGLMFCTRFPSWKDVLLECRAFPQQQDQWHSNLWNPGDPKELLGKGQPSCSLIG